MTHSHRFPLLAAGLFGLTGVALGAFGAHGLEEFLTARGTTHAWESAARYQLFHAVALVAVAAWLRTATGAAAARVTWAARAWCVGIVLFSGSLYGLAAGGPRWLGPVTPLGGLALMVGWALLIAAALAKHE
jgi:uncharacterized membrane protein YgdD (TMEM256/DUF423 family)